MQFFPVPLLTRANWWISEPIIPETKDNGRKTTTSWSKQPSARFHFAHLKPQFFVLHLSRWRRIFSRTTMESFTKIPITSDIAKREIIFMVQLVAHMPIRAVTNNVGIAIMTITAFRRLCKNTNITRVTNKTANNKSSLTALTEASVKLELSWMMVNFKFLDI